MAFAEDNIHGILLKSPLFSQIKDYITKVEMSKKHLFIIAPYIKRPALTKLLDGVSTKVVIVTSWKPIDLIQGSSDLTIYQFCKENKFTLYINNEIHLKVFSGGFDDIILSTSNVSNSGLMPGGNVECAVFVPTLDNMDRLYFAKIIHDSRLVDSGLFDDISRWYEQQKYLMHDIVAPSFEEIVRSRSVDDFLISALPMTKTVDILMEAYQRISSGLSPSEDWEVRECVFHDLSKYDMPFGLSQSDFKNNLRIAFFSHPFIRKIDELISPEIHFGRLKEWIQKNCTDVPVPSRRELTANVQVLLNWFQELGENRYVVDIPGSHSQRIRKLF